MKKIIITGGTGFVGIRLAELLLEQGYAVVIMSRNCDTKDNVALRNLHSKYNESLQCATWNTEKKTMDSYSISTADAIINLAGAGVADERWTEERKNTIVSSRVKANQTIIESLKLIPNNIKTIVNASAIGWYGDDRDRRHLIPFVEDTTPANDFLASTCVAWEESINPLKDLVRLVKLRIGIVLGLNGGAYPQFKKTLMMRVASVLGDGKQVVSWIHIDDLCRLFIYALENDKMEGVYNAVAPYSVTNERLVKTIAEEIHSTKYAKLKVPKTILKMALGEMSVEVLKSCLVSSRKVLDSGFIFQYPKVSDAVKALEASEKD